MRTKQPSQRQLRVGEEIRHILSDVLARQNIHHPLIYGKLITITEVKVSPDLKNAIAFVMSSSNNDIDSILEGLETSKKYFKQELAKTLRLRFMPELKFVYDNRLEEALRIENLLNLPDVVRDLKKDADANGDSIL
ncbi:MAG: 30S ribosome-binding factor RbfA [Alphaproteobacteria bacterium]